MKIIAFGYRRGCGKDTLAKMIQRELRLKAGAKRVHVMGFADQLKAVAYGLYGWTGLRPGAYYEENVEAKDQLLANLPNGCITPRDLWIKLGNLLREQLDPDVWINALLKTIHGDVLILKDLRFPGEITSVQDHHGRVMLLNRPGTEGNDSEPDTVLMNETRWDRIIENSGGLTHLHKIACGLAEELI